MFSHQPAVGPCTQTLWDLGVPEFLSPTGAAASVGTWALEPRLLGGKDEKGNEKHPECRAVPGRVSLPQVCGMPVRGLCSIRAFRDTRMSSVSSDGAVVWPSLCGLRVTAECSELTGHVA